jgi:hypothetical protein
MIIENRSSLRKYGLTELMLQLIVRMLTARRILRFRLKSDRMKLQDLYLRSGLNHHPRAKGWVFDSFTLRQFPFFPKAGQPDSPSPPLGAARLPPSVFDRMSCFYQRMFKIGPGYARNPITKRTPRNAVTDLTDVIGADEGRYDFTSTRSPDYH